jgi:hypothetical protein
VFVGSFGNEKKRIELIERFGAGIQLPNLVKERAIDGTL